VGGGCEEGRGAPARNALARSFSLALFSTSDIEKCRPEPGDPPHNPMPPTMRSHSPPCTPGGEAVSISPDDAAGAGADAGAMPSSTRGTPSPGLPLLQSLRLAASSAYYTTADALGLRRLGDMITVREGVVWGGGLFFFFLFCIRSARSPRPCPLIKKHTQQNNRARRLYRPRPPLYTYWARATTPAAPTARVTQNPALHPPPQTPWRPTWRPCRASPTAAASRRPSPAAAAARREGRAAEEAGRPCRHLP
jgi:hypothetical protein